jgi:hypothetical protein
MEKDVFIKINKKIWDFFIPENTLKETSKFGKTQEKISNLGIMV